MGPSHSMAMQPRIWDCFQLYNFDVCDVTCLVPDEMYNLWNLLQICVKLSQLLIVIVSTTSRQLMKIDSDWFPPACVCVCCTIDYRGLVSSDLQVKPHSDRSGPTFAHVMCLGWLYQAITWLLEAMLACHPKSVSPEESSFGPQFHKCAWTWFLIW